MYATLLTALEFVSWLQPPPSAGGGGDGGAGAAAPASDGLMGCAGGGGLMGWGYIVAMIAIFWFLVISPQRKQAKATETMLKGLQKGDIVRTNGGIRGEIVSIDEREIVLKIAEKTKINVLRTHVSGPDAAVETGAAKDK